MKTIIIDDENRARRVLKSIIEDSCIGIEKILEASNLVDGIELIKKEQPEVVFLDIEMPKHSGLEIVDFFKEEPIPFQIIFTTAYQEYAIEAFKLSAIDYLLKPLDENEVINALEKAKNVLHNNDIKSKLQNLQKALHQLSLNKIALVVPKGIVFTSHDEILYFEADGVYTKVHLVNGKTELICKTLKHFTNQLKEQPSFYKPHRSYLINLKFMKELVKKDGFHIVMQNLNTIPIARDRKDEFIQMVNRVFN